MDGSSCSGLDIFRSERPGLRARRPFAASSADSTTVSLTTNAASQPYGNEGGTVFTVTVSTENGEELPAVEYATVDVGTTTCLATLTPATGGATGSCSIGPDDLGVGPTTASVTYDGDADLDASSPATAPFTVTAAAPPPTISGVSFSGSLSSPTVTVTGSGFGAQSDLGSPAVPYCNTLTGSNYGNNFDLTTASA